jgi:hypothetical protein
MVGRTALAIAHWNRRFVHVPLAFGNASRVCSAVGGGELLGAAVGQDA